MNMKPVGNRILVEVDDQTAAPSKGGIIIPQASQDLPNTGTVRELGRCNKRENGTEYPFTVKKGDRVMLDRFGGTTVPDPGNLYRHYRLVTEESILAILS